MSNAEIIFISLSELGSNYGGFAYILQSKWVGIITIKTDRMQIDFLRNVLISLSHCWILKSLLWSTFYFK